MAKRPSNRRDVQKQIERLDRELVKLANERARLYAKAAESKKQDDDSAGDATSEQAAIQEVVASSKGPLGQHALRAILREVASGSRALTRPLRVAYLGPEHSYSHQATIERFGQSAELVPVANIAAVFEEVNRRQADFGVVPIENSTDGRVVDTLDMFARLPVHICGEVQLRIHHNLLGKCSRGEVREVYSKPQALSQCRDWLARHLPQARIVEAASTSAAAKTAAEKPGAAAVASLQAGTQFGLDVLAAHIEDSKNNVTRFAVIGHEPPPRSGNDKTSLMFEIPHQPGSLADVMGVFKRNRLNLTWIESFPLPDSKSEYLFFVELEGHADDLRVRRALEALRRKTTRLEVLGCYARTQPVD